MTILTLGKRHEATPQSALLGSIESLKHPRQRRHELWILSCYVDIKEIQNLVREVAARVRLVDVYLAFDYSEVYRYGVRNIRRRLAALSQSCTKQKLNLEYQFLVVPGGLAHGKGYAIMQRVSGEVTGGSLLIGSANMTSPGFTGGRNVELGVLSQAISQLRSFESAFDRLWETYGQEKVTDTTLQNDEDLFKFALLSSGVFLHRWDGSLRQLVGIRYKLVDEEKWAQLPDNLRNEGFELSKTLTRHVLKLDELPERPLPNRFIQNFTIDTALGRWCPIEIWDEVTNPESEPDEYLDAFRAATTDEILHNVIADARNRQQALIDEGFLAPVDGDHLRNWGRRIRRLRDAPEYLARLHTKYEAFPMPLDAQRKNDIDELFESIQSSIELKTRTNWTTRAVRACLASKSLIHLKLDEKTRTLLQPGANQAIKD